MEQWIKCLLNNCEDMGSNSNTQVKSDPVANTCNPSTLTERCKAETGEPLEAGRLAGLAYPVEKARSPVSNRAEGKGQCFRLSSDIPM